MILFAKFPTLLQQNTFTNTLHHACYRKLCSQKIRGVETIMLEVWSVSTVTDYIYGVWSISMVTIIDQLFVRDEVESPGK